MRQFEIATAQDSTQATTLAGDAPRDALGTGGAYFLAGGTNLLDLMKLDVMRPARLVGLEKLRRLYGSIEIDETALRLGALVRMSEAADHPVIRRDYPVIADALWMAASPQLRNMASLAGNVLQRTRCLYFRDRTYKRCNKRNPGAGCEAMEGVNRRLAVLGVSDHCIANYPGDFAIALAALGADVVIATQDGGVRSIPFENLHCPPGATPHVETTLAHGELITGLSVPAGPWTRRSRYVKVRDRASYDFALASAAVALDLAPDGAVREARIGIGGLVAKPWRSHEAEAALAGRPVTESVAREAAEAAFASAVTHGETSFKPELGRRTLVRALLEAAAMEVAP